MPDVSKSVAAKATEPREGDGNRTRNLQSHNRSAIKTAGFAGHFGSAAAASSLALIDPPAANSPRPTAGAVS